jgi:hypothetical protein
MPKDLLSDFEPEEAEVETASDDTGKDITLDDLGEDKELNTPPQDGDGDRGDQIEEEAEADKPEEAVTEKKTEKTEEAATKPPADQAAKTDADKTTEAVLKYLGLDSTLKIKGKEYKLADFAKEDLLALIQKGTRMTQIGQELSQKERLLAERERVAEANALQATRLLQTRPEAGATKAATEPPPALAPSEYDTEDVKSVKQAALSVWKQNQEQAQRLNAIEGGLRSQETEAKSKEFMDDLNAHRADFPLASVEEVIAVHSLRPDIPISDLVRRSHGIYGSVEHVKEVFKHAPEVRKAVEDEVIAAYLARNSKARVLPQKPSVQGARPVPAAKHAIRGFEDAGQAARRALARIAQEGEGDND